MELMETSKGLDLALASTEDRISAYMMGKIDKGELQAKDEELMGRWLSVWQNLIQFMPPGEAVLAHMKTQEECGRTISERTAWSDYRHATKVWGPVTQMNQQARYTLLYECAVKTFNMCQELKDTREMNRAMKNLIVLAELMNDGNEQVSAPVMIINMNVPGEGTKTINLADLKSVPEDELQGVIEDIDSVEIEDAKVMEMLNGSSQSDKTE